MTIASVSKVRPAIALSFVLAVITGFGSSSAAYAQEAECEGVCDAMYSEFIWKYGDSTVRISMDGKDGFVITYEQPRQGLIDEGVKPGDVMFSGKITDSDMIYGVSRLRRKDCGAINFQTSGAGNRQEGVIKLTGKMPKRGPTCLVEKYIDANIELSRLSPIPGSPMGVPNAVQPPQQASIPVPSGAGGCRAPNGSIVQLDSAGCAAIGGSPISGLLPCRSPNGAVIQLEAASCQTIGGQVITGSVPAQVPAPPAAVAVAPVVAPPAPPPAPAPAPAAAPVAAAFGNNDIGRIAQTASENETRFQRDYKGKTLAFWGTFDSLQDGFWGSKQLAVNVGDTAVHCYGTAQLAKKAIDWNSGDRLYVQGKIRDTILGILQIDDCDADKR